ncbi:MBL fold metallo-hydrolase [Undibacterium baiyunense]|uniref:MBL fold metallo-hydrolase n=1 Tax=Undibacterium baiyunense TaxID=2828731 RepID=A0A941DEZ2_9BURK|nr:MBL fold metallo-hydrolase [Undibacterium baiyunense]MBR7747534.1 MBL fold metallo-hydrolase [Undibacterium baiyunense]
MKFRLSSVAFALAALTAGMTVVSAPALADAPMAKSAAPGYYRVMLGDFEVTALSDGVVALPVDKLLTNTQPEKIIKALQKHHLSTPTATSVNGYLINTGSKLVLIDTGAATLFGTTLGRLANSLKAAGYMPEQVDEVYITHMHGDHVGGLMNGDQLAFPNAIVRADQHDADFWLSQANMDKAPADAKGAFQGAMASINPYVKAGKFKTFNGDTELVPGVKAIAARGHTPGHSVYAVESKGQKLMLWGDLMHVAAVQFENPTVTISFDSDSKAAMAQRLKAYADAAKQGYMVGATHLSFPGLGYVRKEGKAYAWVPVNYVPVK